MICDIADGSEFGVWDKGTLFANRLHVGYKRIMMFFFPIYIHKQTTMEDLNNNSILE